MTVPTGTFLLGPSSYKSQPHGQDTRLMANVTVNVNRFVFIPVRASHARLFGACGGVSGGEGPEHETKVRQTANRTSNQKRRTSSHMRGTCWPR